MQEQINEGDIVAVVGGQYHGCILTYVRKTSVGHTVIINNSEHTLRPAVQVKLWRNTLAKDRPAPAFSLTGNLIEDCKRALDANMQSCAAHTNRLRSLKAIADAGAITAKVFCTLAGQDPSTLERDLLYAQQDFTNAKRAYETFCERTGQPAYATYNED